MSEHVSVHLRWSLLLDDHPDTPPPTYEVNRGVGLVPPAFAGDHPFCVATIHIPGREPAVGWRSMVGVRQGDPEGWGIRCTDALGMALHAAGYPATVQELKYLARWRQLKQSPLLERPAEEEPSVFSELVDLDTVMASLGPRRAALIAWAKDQGIWPPFPEHVDRLLHRASELATDQVFAETCAIPQVADPVAAAREFLADAGVDVPEPEPIEIDTVDATTARIIADLDDRLAEASDIDIKRMAGFLEDNHFPLLLEEMGRAELDELTAWLESEGIIS